MTIKPDDLCERLEAMRADRSRIYDVSGDAVDCLFREAAALIRQLQRENAALREALKSIAGAIRLGSESDVVAWAGLATALQREACSALSAQEQTAGE